MFLRKFLLIQREIKLQKKKKKRNTLEGHPKSVLCLKFDSKHLVSGSEDPAIHVWDVKSGVLMNRLHGHTDSVSSIVIQYLSYFFN